MTGMIYDVSVPITNAMPVWPGDPPVQLSAKSHLSQDKSHTVKLTAIEMGSHTGTHMDAPRHFIPGGKGIDVMPLDATVGKARVIEIRDTRSIGPEELKKHGLRRGERILFKTKNSKRCWKAGAFVEDFVYISLEGAKFLAKKRVKAVGVDYLSVGGFKDDGSATHRVLLKSGIWIIEGLDLSAVKAGRYELICLPLKFWRGDGAPARAVLRRLG